MTGTLIAALCAAAFLAVPYIVCRILGSRAKPAAHDFPAAPLMKQRPRTPGDPHWGIVPTRAEISALQDEAREITRVAALAYIADQKVQATCPSSQAANAQEGT